MKCDGCGREDKALFRTNPTKYEPGWKGEPGIFKCRSCIDGQPRIGLGFERELLDAIDPQPEMGDLRR